MLKNESKTLAVMIGMASMEKEALETLGKYKNESLENQISGTAESWKKWITNFKTDKKDEQLASMTNRSLQRLNFNI